MLLFYFKWCLISRTSITFSNFFVYRKRDEKENICVAVEKRSISSVFKLYYMHRQLRLKKFKKIAEVTLIDATPAEGYTIRLTPHYS